jgi:hypothetical protein
MSLQFFCCAGHGFAHLQEMMRENHLVKIVILFIDNDISYGGQGARKR